MASEDDSSPNTSYESTVVGPVYNESDFDPAEYTPDDGGIMHVPTVTLLAPPQTVQPTGEHTNQQQPPRNKRKSTSPPELAALLNELKLMREDLKAARAKEFALRERQLNMQEKLFDAMMKYFNKHSA